MLQLTTYLLVFLATTLYTFAHASPQSLTVTPTVIIAATVTITEAAPTLPLSTTYTDATTFKTSMLNSTNFYRYEHSANFLTWNSTLASYAQTYAKKCIWAHSHGPYGENLAQGYVDVAASVDAWGNERSLYSWKGSQTGFSEATGHFTQLVWKDTLSVGCAAVECDGRNDVAGVYVVCEYYPAGNIVGENNLFFQQNVGQQANQGQGFNVASATNPPTLTVASTTTVSALTIPSASASASGGNALGSEAPGESSRRRGWWAVVATVGALILASGMC